MKKPIKNAFIILSIIIGWVTDSLPLIALPSVEQEYELCGEALIAAGQEQWEHANSLLQGRQCPTTKKLVIYLRLKSDNCMASFEEYTHFIEQNPQWPWGHVLKKRAELVAQQTASLGDILAWFKKNPPTMAKGIIAHINALKKKGFPKEARLIFEKAWVKQDFSQEEEKLLMTNYKEWSTRSLHLLRAQRLLRENKVDMALRLASFLPKSTQNILKVRLALREKQPEALKLLKALAYREQQDIGIIYDALQFYLRTDNPEAYNHFKKHKSIIESHPILFWPLRHTLGRDLMASSRYKEAYAVVHSHGLTQGEGFADAEWFSGWLALRFMTNPSQAFHHFNTFYQKVTSPYSRSKAAYWAGRASHARKLPQEAQLWFQKAAAYPATYYGQLALKALKKPLNFQLKTLNLSTAESRHFENHEFVRAIKLLHEAGLENELLSFGYVFSKISPPHESLLMLALASKLSPHFAVGMADSMSILHNTHYIEAYPQVDFLEAGDEQSLEQAIIHALIRKESKFNASALSHQGACGMMQVQPATAKMVAQKLGVPFDEERLRSDKEYNMLIGTAYLKERLKDYQGSLILTLAAYNAGPGSVKKWIAKYGDPRSPSMNAIDWVEMIPYSETRNYIQRVLENVIIYQAIFKQR